MSASQATEVRNLIETNWSLTGNLSKTPTSNMEEIVRFFDRDQVLGNEWPKAVVVRKINDAENENRDVHPNYTILNDVYEITVYYRVVDVQEINFSDALLDIENMAKEVQRILDTTIQPMQKTGPWFTQSTVWHRNDLVEQAQPELRRTMRYSLTQMIGNEQVFRGYAGLLQFDAAGSEGSGTNYTYTEVKDVDIKEGYDQISLLTKDKQPFDPTQASNDIPGIPQVVRGMWRGSYSMLLQAKREDYEGSGVEKIPNIYKTLSTSPNIGQVAEVVFVHGNDNTESTSQRLTTKSFMRIDNVEKIDGDEALIQYKVSGILTRPTEYSVGATP